MIKKHLLGFLFTALVGAIYVAPNIIFSLSPEYKGLPMMFTDAESFYLSRINGVYKDCSYLCNPYIKEYASSFPFYDVSIAEQILAYPGILLGIPAIKLKVIHEFLLPFILTLLIYFLIFRITKKRSISVAGSVLIMLGYNLVNYQHFINFLTLFNTLSFHTDETQFFIFSRPVYPQFSSVYFLILMHTLLSTIEKGGKKWYLLLGLAYGISFYIYFFIYTFATVVLGVLILWKIFDKKWNEVLFGFVAMVLGIMLAIPQILNIKALMSHPYYFTIPTSYLELTRIPHISLYGIGLFAVFISCMLLYKKKYVEFTPPVIFIGILVAACFVTRNQHVVSGMIMQYNHFEVYIFTPIIVFVLCLLMSVFMKGKGVWLASIVVVMCLVNGILIQYSSYKHWHNYAVRIQSNVGVLEWLRTKVPNGSIVAAPEPLVSLIPVYTSHYVLWSWASSLYMSIPGRTQEITEASQNMEHFLELAKKYGVEHVIEEAKRPKLKTQQKPLYSDKNYIVYKI